MDDTHISGLSGDPSPKTPEARQRGRCRSIAFQVAAVALTFVSALAGTGLARWLRNPESETAKTPAVAGKFPGRLFKDWKKPDLVLVVSAQQQGYLLPCGCSEPQIGGLERRYNLLQMIKAAGWPYVAVDGGDMAQRHAPANLPNEQGLIKYRYSMKALKEMNYTAVTFGENEANLGLQTVLAEYALNDPSPRVVAGNLMDAEKNFPEMTKPWELASTPGSAVKVGVTSIVGPSVAARIKELTRADATLKFERSSDALNRGLREMAASGVNLPVLLYQGPVSRNGMKKPQTEAMACAEVYPQFPVIVCLSDEDEAPSRPTVVRTRTGSESMVVSLGRKGKFIGVIGVYRTGKAAQPLRFEYERVELNTDFVTPRGKEAGHPIVELMETYTRELKSQHYLENHGRIRHALQVMPKVEGLRRPVEVTYVGSDKCKSCHEDAYNIWKKTPHSHAYQTLVTKAKHPSNRQFDPECIVCHTVGFGIVSGFVTDDKTPNLKDVGCESCHGPASAHVANPSDLAWQKRINPWRHLPAAKRQDAMDQMCQKCHDIDNDVTWIHGGFKKKWPRVAHPTEKPAVELP